MQEDRSIFLRSRTESTSSLTYCSALCLRRSNDGCRVFTHDAETGRCRVGTVKQKVKKSENGKLTTYTCMRFLYAIIVASL